ncbi:hypothetical protein KCP74_09795 [Salmonella enterica subsp. enterica]|nr:hypothetical protein KCP74_09795 [Salmonella enterica subsp. enterica]
MRVGRIPDPITDVDDAIEARVWRSKRLLPGGVRLPGLSNHAAPVGWAARQHAIRQFYVFDKAAVLGSKRFPCI